MKKITFLLASALLLIVSCNRNNEEPEVEFSDYVVILNQGNFSDQSGSISIYNEEENSVTNRVFESANNNISIGSIIMGGDFTPDNRLLILCSSPDKILILNPFNMGLISTLNDEMLSSTRDIKSDNNYIYVSNYGTDYIENEDWSWEFINSYVAIYNINTLQLVDTLHVGSDAEGMLLDGNNLYVATKQGVVVIKTGSAPKIETKICDSELGAAKYLVKNEKTGNLYASFPSYGIVEINSSNNTIVKRFEMEIESSTGYIAINSDYSKIYSIYTAFDDFWAPVSSSINELDISTGTVKKFAQGDYFYSVGVNPFSDNVYASEVSFTSNSNLEVFNKNGDHIGTHAVGIGTYKYLFMRFNL